MRRHRSNAKSFMHDDRTSPGAGLHAIAFVNVDPILEVQMPSRRVLYLQPDKFDFHVTGRGSDLLKDALDRCMHM